MNIIALTGRVTKEVTYSLLAISGYYGLGGVVAERVELLRGSQPFLFEPEPEPGVIAEEELLAGYGKRPVYDKEQRHHHEKMSES